SSGESQMYNRSRPALSKGALGRLIVGLVLAAGASARADEASLPCTARQSHNGSALCVSLRVVGGQVAMNRFVFTPNGSYDAEAIGDRFAPGAHLPLPPLTQP